ncbi:MAG: gliding motility-associated C-terminal domain-containing protein [Gelidibacter sp.]
MKALKPLLFLLFFGVSIKQFGQNIELYQQFNGRYDYTAIGNTLNPFENNIVQSFCDILPSSQANLNLPNTSTIVAAYLYWAGSGVGDTNITLNGTSVDADLTYNVSYNNSPTNVLTYFSCFADVTNLVTTQGNTTYELSDLDISETLANNTAYCANRTNFAGWSIYIIYEDDNLPLNQVNLFQGLEIIDRNNTEKTIILNNLNVIDNQNAKIGFLAWEGDNALNYGESLSINGNILSNPPLNYADNAFNGTNTFTNSNTFYNCDLDVYNIQDNIQIGDTAATIQMTTGGFDNNGIFQADLIIINNIITVLNSQLPDATIAINEAQLNCQRELNVDYTVFNTNATDVLPAHTPIAFYADGLLIGQSETQSSIAIGGFENGTIQLTIPPAITDNFTLTVVVDDNGQAIGTVTETDETNNTFETTLTLLTIPPVLMLPSVTSCNEGFNSAVFNLVDSFLNDNSTTENFSFYTSLSDLETNENEIFMPEAFSNTTNPQTIYVKLQTPPCYEVYQFDVGVENCPPHVPQGFSPNTDGFNDWFNIQGLYNVFENHQLLIYNRYGTLIFEGDNNTPWDGKANRGLNNLGKLLPVGTYFYVLHLNDPNYKSIAGWVYMSY